ncbi:hypothetical protein [Bacillus horti]|uniref:Calcineurin-like phosphoesterase family protein n=1 Tax=Caldalkalibacillus horti TaxID=77523 RepID=A0ABT9W046_9BACI|nr:hypothetical protein [Bacillus horti]MDQ0166601.1 calcineurin-like phosphoesterase family protein [Bacillus horti]
MINTWLVAETGWENYFYKSRSIHESEEASQNIDLWNSIVQPNDIIYHLGNVFNKKSNFNRRILKELNGYKILRIGHSDKRNLKQSCLKVFDEVYEEDILLDGQLCLSHYPLDDVTSQKLINNGIIVGNVYGRKGSRILDPSRYYCISAMQTSHSLIHINDVRKHFAII